MNQNWAQAETARLAELRHYRILDTARDARFDRITRLAANLLRARIAFISFLDDHREWFKSSFGGNLSALPREGSICADAIGGQDILEIQDMTQDPRYSDRPILTSLPGTRFLAGAPLITPLGFRLGILGIADHEPRRLSDDDRQSMLDFSRLAIDELELHRAQQSTRYTRLQIALDEALFQPQMDQAFSLIAVLRLDGTLVDVHRLPSAEHQALFQDDIGQPLWKWTWWKDLLDEQAQVRAATERAANGEACRFETMVHVDSRVYSLIDLMITPMRDAEGRVANLILSIADISAHKSVEAQLRQCEIRFRGTFENAAVGMAQVSLTSRWLYVNQLLLDILGYTQDEMLSKTLPDITHPDDLPGHIVQFSRLKVGDIDSYTREKRYVRKDGTFVWVNVTVSLQRSESGDPLFAIMVIEDITARKETEERQRLLLGELNHRVKNIMSMTQSIANQSLRYSDSVQDFVTSFRARLQAMGRAHDLLTQESWQRADLAELVLSQTTAGGMVEPDRIHASGPSIFLPGQVALNFALVLHELTSNALKYGALSISSGYVVVSWSIERTKAGNDIHLIWQERNGPPAQAPSEHGFGMTLIDRSLRQALGADVQMDWSTGGLIVNIVLPLPDIHHRNEYFNP